MELTSPSVSDLFFAKGDMSLTLERGAPAETAFEHTVQDITAQIIGLGDGKLDLYVPSEAIIEPISPAEVMPEESALVVSKDKSMENGMPIRPLQSDHFSDAQEGLNVRVDIASSCDMSLKDMTSNSTAPGDTEISKEPASARKFIPPKKDRMEPLKMDMSKPKVIPLTSSQLSLQCLECHIIFSDDRSKRRHLKMNHPSEYEQCILGDALFACYVCDRHFTCSAELMAHQRSHTEKQPFKCPICGEAFCRSSELTSHKKTHYNKQGYTCSDCGKLFRTLTLLKYHQRIHTGEKPYVCIHKDCGKRFTMPKALQKHLEAHEKKKNLTNATSKTRKKRGPSSKKYACSQCNESFKTAKSMLHHNKTKHSQCSTITPSNSAVTAGSPCVATLTEVVELPLQHMDANGQAAQQIGALEAEQIKRLIEKMGNVQKVNQLVILGLDRLPLQAQGSEMQQPQGLVQPLHFDFTQPTLQQAVRQPAGNKRGHEETSTAAEQDTLGVEVEQKKIVVQNGKIISAAYPGKLVVVESNMTGEQVNDIQDHVLPELAGKNILSPQLEISHQVVLTTEEQQIQDATDVKTPETGNDSSLNLIAEFESRVMSEKEFVTPTDITVSENAGTNVKPNQTDPTSADSLIKPENQTVHGNVVNLDMTNTIADPPSQMASEALDSLIEPELQTVQANLDNLDKTSNNTETQKQKAMETTDSLVEPQAETDQKKLNLDNGQKAEPYLEHQQLKEILSTEDEILQMSEPFLGNIQRDQERCPLEQAHCEASIQQNRVESEDQTLLTEDSPYIKKTLPKKEKKVQKAGP